MMYWFGTGVSGWGYVLMIISMVVFWGLLGVSVFFLFRSGSRDDSQPEKILAQRLARGEIDELEYRRRLSTLHGLVRS